MIDETAEQRRKRWREYYHANPESMRAIRKRYQIRHKDRLNERARQRHADNPQYIRDYLRQWAPKNRDRIRGYYERRKIKAQAAIEFLKERGLLDAIQRDSVQETRRAAIEYVQQAGLLPAPTKPFLPPARRGRPPKLTAIQMAAIRERLIAGEMVKSIAAEFSLDLSVIYKIRNNIDNRLRFTVSRIRRPPRSARSKRITALPVRRGRRKPRPEYEI